MEGHSKKRCIPRDWSKIVHTSGFQSYSFDLNLLDIAKAKQLFDITLWYWIREVMTMIEK